MSFAAKSESKTINQTKLDRQKYGLEPETGNVDSQIKRSIKGTAIVFFGAITGQLLNYAIRVVIARVYGPDVFGKIGIASSVMAIGLSIAVMGLPIGVARFISFHRGTNETQNTKYIFFAALISTIITSTIIGASIFNFAHIISHKIFHSEELTKYIRVFSITLILAAISRILMGSLRGFEEIKKMVFTGTLIPEVSILLGILIVTILSSQNYWLCYAYLYGYLISVSFSFIVLSRHIFPAPNFTKNYSIYYIQLKTLFFFSWPLLFTTVLHQFRFSTDRFMLGYYTEPSKVGIYMAATPLIRIIIIIVSAFGTPSLPILTQHYRSNLKKEMQKLFYANNRLIFYIAYPILLFTVFFPESIINILFGIQYLEGSNALRILAIGIMIFILSGITETFINAGGKSKIILIAELTSFIINISLNIVFIPIYSISGAAAATAISFASFSLILIFYLKKHMKIWPFNFKLVKFIIIYSFLYIFILFIIFLFFPRNNILTFIISILLMFFCIYITIRFTGLESEETAIIMALKRKLRF